MRSARANGRFDPGPLSLLSPRRFRPVRDPEAPPRGPDPGQEGLPPLRGPQHGHREEDGLPGDHPPRWRSGRRRGARLLLTAGVTTALLPAVAGNVRNDFYVTLLQGEFDRGKKKTPKNVEVILSVHDDEGNPMEVLAR